MKFKSNVELEALSNATTDTDRFIVSDSNTLKYRTGSQVLSDIGGQASLTNPVTGTGTLNFVSKFTSTGSTLGNSVIYDNGTNVGIGTTNPSQKTTILTSNESLHDVLGVYNAVTGTSALGKGAAIRIGSSTEGAYSTKIATIYEGNNPDYLQPALAFFTMNNTYLKGSEVERMRISANGNVGIGTTSPGTKLHVGTGSGATVDTGYQLAVDSAGIAGIQILAATNQSSRVVFGDSDDNDVGMLRYDHTDNSMRFITNGSGSERMRITSSGNVGIGTTNPGYKLDVVGNAYISTTLQVHGNINFYDDLIGTSYKQGTTAVRNKRLKNIILESSTETNQSVVHPYFNNSLGNFIAKGGTITFGNITTPPSLSQQNLMFQPNQNFMGLAASNITASTWSMTLTSTNSGTMDFTYGCWIGITFGSAAFDPDSCLIEVNTNADGSGTWTTALNSTVSDTGYFTYFASGGTGIKSIRFTMGQTSQGPRVCNIYAYNYAASGMNEFFLSKAGGYVFGDIIPGTDYLSGGTYLPKLGGTGNRWNEAYINKLADINNSFGTSGQVLSSNASGQLDWISGGSLPGGPYLPLAGGTMTGTNGVLMPDNFKLNIGTGSDLQIYHDGSDSYIDDTGTGWLRLRGNGGVILSSYSEGETMLQATRNGAVNLYYDNVKKFETTSLGVTVTGNGNFIGSLSVGTTAGASIAMLRTSANYIDATNATGYLVFRTGGYNTALTLSAAQHATFAGDVNVTGVIDTAQYINVGTQNSTFSENNIRFRSAGPAYLDHNTVSQSIKFRLSSVSSIDVIPFEITPSYMASSVDMYFGDNDKLRLGASSDLQIYHDGSNSYINESGTGDLYVQTNGTNMFLRDSASGNTFIAMNIGTADVSLRQNGNIKLTTTSTGVTVTGAATATTFLGDLNGTINTVTTAVTKANSTNDTTVATTAFVQNLIGTIPAGLVFQGTWNAATNTPTLTSGTGTTGHFYIVSTSGSTNLDGVTDWVTGDWAVFIEQGATDAWEKVDNSSVLDGAGTGQTVALWSGSGTSNTLDDSILTQSGGSIITQTATSVAQYSLDSIAANDSVVNFKQAGVQKAKIGYDHSEDALAFIHGSGAFSTAGMVLDGTGVGIGTTSPGANLEVAKGSEGLYLKVGGDNASNGRGLTFSSSSNNGSVGALHTINATSVSGAISLNTAGVSRLFLDRLGNVGIGTASPQTELHIKGNNGWGEIRIEGQTFASGHGASLEFYSGGTALADIYANTSKDLILRTNGTTERMRITSAGNVGIGTTGPTYKLAVSGGIEAGGKVTYSKSAGSLDTTGYAVAGLLAASNGNSCMFIFTAIGHTGHYQKVVYSCWNAAGIWNTSKVIDEGTNGLDVEASANAATITFTFKSRSGSLNYTPRVTVEASGAAINNTYA